jgi:hypothetical protein
MNAADAKWLLMGAMLVAALPTAGCTVDREKHTQSVTTVDHTVTHYPDGASSSSTLSTTREP